MKEYHPTTRAFMWAANRAWEVAHRVGRVDVGDDHWLSTTLYRAALICEGVWGSDE